MLRYSALLVLLLVAAPGCQQPGAPPIDDFGPVGPFSLTERSDRPITQDNLRGKVWIASFVFIRCTGPCPQVSGTMARLQKELAGEPDVRLVTFTVDPERDNPKELAQYAESFQADPERWLFLTGKEETIHKLLREGFKVPVERNQGKVEPGQEVMHSPRLVVVDRHGHIRGYFSGIRSSQDHDPERAFEDNLKRLRQTVAALLKEPS